MPRVSTRCHTCDEDLEDEARFCGVCGVSLVDENFGRTVARRYLLRQRVGAEKPAEKDKEIEISFLNSAAADFFRDLASA